MPRRKTVSAPTVTAENYWDDILVKLGYKLPYLPLEQVTVQATQQPIPAKPSMSDDMRIFAERLIYALCPPEKAYAPVIVKTVKTIYDVLNGAKDFTAWFTEVKQALSLKNYQLASVIYECLEGLRSKEAKELREQWYGYIQAELKGYGVI
jgi:hypothetical protein